MTVVPPLGATVVEGGVAFAVAARHAEWVEVCVFDAAGHDEVVRVPLAARAGDVHHGVVAGLGAGARYGFRAHGPWAPLDGHRYNPAKLLVDPYATRLDRPFACVPTLLGQHADGTRDERDSARLLPKAIVEPAGVLTMEQAIAARRARRFAAEHTVTYELHVKGFTATHPAMPPALRGTCAGLAHPAAVEHLVQLGVTTVELMPLAAAIDEPHLARAGLTNYWRYSAAAWLAPDPTLAPGGMAEVRAMVATLQAAGLEVLLDVVFNHTGEGDAHGPTITLRGLDNAMYYRLVPGHRDRYVNDTGCGNTVALDRPIPMRLALDALRHWALAAGVDGFRYDLATTLGRRAEGFDAEAPLFAAIQQDPLLRELRHVAEPWDIGPGGHRLGSFAPGWGEWNDAYRDAVRTFWRGAGEGIGALATRVVGSPDLFRGRHRAPSDSVNFVTAHDGFTLADLVSYVHKRNAANAEGNRDGTDDNRSWNHGVEGPTDDPEVREARQRDVRALLATLLCSRGTPMLLMGDELGRTQGGNNNAYAQDNATTWVDWATADDALARFTAGAIAVRQAHQAIHADIWLTRETIHDGLPDVDWRRPDGAPMEQRDWTEGQVRTLTLVLTADDAHGADRVLLALHPGLSPVAVHLPEARPGHRWRLVLESATGLADPDSPTVVESPILTLAPRSVTLLAESPRPGAAATAGTLDTTR
ncbi:MAG: glycogen debranching protein GlgX [Gemmatimonadota bacterium]|nr:glycogen debranching protein GlgX [Gemmatimonadota bacterium]